MIDTFPCPKCGRRCARSGEVEVKRTAFPAFSCDKCVTSWEVDGESFVTAFTFVVDAEGQPFNPASDDGK
jgi:hypothetical protein